ncbi:hypothetical protein HYALB_00006607 [Hymenoscyphus albidus]|uniref:Uncharacterized protein n=1 Tax=Hymenoscyphus albidus TaxID=595503 RepID=A0A9N9Q7P0_9HELO|nr:hypothetical protein HYALB_00006607 [Hymenoscyphus albidus]
MALPRLKVQGRTPDLYSKYWEQNTPSTRENSKYPIVIPKALLVNIGNHNELHWIPSPTQAASSQFHEKYLWGWYGELWCLALATIPWFIRMLYLGILDDPEEQRLVRIRDFHVLKQGHVLGDPEKCKDSMRLRVPDENGAFIE